MIRRSLHLPVSIGVGTLVSALVLSPVAALALSTTKEGVVATATPAAATGLFTATKTVTRVHLINGADVPVDSRKVTVTVNETVGLRDRQGITVSWTGARPTAGIVADPNSDKASQQEYPVVILQCRGVDSTSVPVARRVSPQTCWTNSPLERYGTDYSDLFPPWRVDRYATPSDRVQWVNAPGPAAGCGFNPKFGSVHYIPFVAASGHVYPGGIYGCGGIAPEAANISSLDLPDNATWAATALDGTGKARFDVRTAEDNASLGCSNTVACSLVVIPIMGVSCDTAAAALPVVDQPGADQAAAGAMCQATGYFKPGELDSNPNGFNDPAVSGSLWWSESNWRNRITVPISFAPLGNVCNSFGGSSPLYFYGSEMMIQATGQWGPAFCTDPTLFTFKHVQTSEPQARNLLQTGNIEAALGSSSLPTGFSSPTVSVPVAVTGWGIGFVIDDAKGEQVTNLKLTARLLAKLLSESYPTVGALQDQVPAFKNNPLNITLDPEFQALNPGIPQSIRNGEAAAALFALSSDSDIIHALTSYINADPDARAFLDGHPDPWGMVVNPAYQGISLPVYNWPLLDQNKPTDLYQPGVNDCLAANPVPYLPLVASPTTRLSTISLALQYGFSFSLTNCSEPVPGSTLGAKLITSGRQANGTRFLLGVTSLGDAARYGIGIASLLTHTDPSAVAKFSDAAGRTFVGPTDMSLTKAVSLFQPDDKLGIWTLDYAGARTTADWQAAYPGTVVVAASIPTRGLPAADAAKYVKWLDYVTTTGQTPGVAAGNLAAGFLPLKFAPAKLAAFSAVAGPAILAQKGQVPSLLANVPTPTPTPTPTPNASSPAPTIPNTQPTPTPTSTPTPSKSTPTVPASPSASPTSPGITAGNPPGALGSALPAIAVIALLAGAASGFVTLRILRAGV